MANEDILQQLRYRRGRIVHLMGIQKIALATELLRSELNYVDAMIEYRERFGGLGGVVLTTTNHPEFRVESASTSSSDIALPVG